MDLKSAVSADMNRREDEEEVGSTGTEHESVSSECETEDGNYEDSEAKADDRNGEQGEFSNIFLPHVCSEIM
jgi:hypothetical protein